MQAKDDFSSLIELLSSEQLGPECLDFIEAHGYITAAVVSPVETSDEQLLEEIMGEGSPSVAPELTEIFRFGILQLKALIARHLLMAEALDIPCELSVGSETEPSDLERWCMAFVEKHFMNENEWFVGDENTVANLLLPVICGSGVVEDEEIEQIRQQPELFINMLEDIPELMVDLYAYYHEK